VASRQRVVLDLSGLAYVSSAGLRCFMLAAKETRAAGGRIVLAALRPVVAEIFQISRFDMVFEIFPSVREALSALSASAAAAFDRG
jgi:anti-anti-sigma factor